MKMNFIQRRALFIGCAATALGVAACQNDRIDSQQTNPGSDREIIANNNPSQKTYQNEKFGFSFIYPSNYLFQNQDVDRIKGMDDDLRLHLTLEDKEEYLYRQSDEGKKQIHFLGIKDINIFVYANPEGLSAFEWVKRKNSDSFPFLKPADYKNIKVAGQPAILYTVPGLHERDMNVFTSPDGRYIFKLSVEYDYHEPHIIRKDFETLKSTFKFEQ